MSVDPRRTLRVPEQPFITRSARIGPVRADPYSWPYDGSVAAENVALMSIDWRAGSRTLPPV